MNPSYAYIYDDFLADRQFERDLAALETSLSAYGLSGRIGRLAVFRSARELISNMVREGVTTIVVVGNDATLDRTMWFLPDLNVTVGYIPMAGSSPVADMLGIPIGIAAGATLSARFVETLDIGKIDDRYFLQEISVPQTMATLDIEGRYRLSPAAGGSLSIRNLGGKSSSGFDASDAKDGKLEVVITPAPRVERVSRWKKPEPMPETRVLFTHGTLISESPIEAFVDHHVLSGFRFEVGIIPNRLKIITGRGQYGSRGEGGLRKTRSAGMFRTTSRS